MVPYLPACELCGRPQYPIVRSANRGSTSSTPDNLRVAPGGCWLTGIRLQYSSSVLFLNVAGGRPGTGLPTNCITPHSTLILVYKTRDSFY